MESVWDKLSAMLTRCPKCDTLFRLTTAQIEAAEGRVRCSRCNEVFNAIEHLRKPVDPPPQVKIAPVVAPPKVAPTTDPIVPPDPIVVAPPPVSRPQVPSPPPEPEVIAPVPRKAAPPPPAEQPKTESTTKVEELFRPPRMDPSIGWGLAVLLLAVALAAQWLWLDRHVLIRDPQGQQLLTALCDIVPCTLPQRREPEKFRVLSRDMSSHPQEKNALLFLLVMANQADFAQPYPYLQLNLFDAERRPAGQRIFKPEEYLSEKPTSDLLAPDHTLYIRLELLDPGPDISGFEIKFL